MISTDLSTSSHTVTVAYGIAQETAYTDEGEVITHHFPALNYQGDGEFVATETFIVDANLSTDEIAAVVAR